MVYQMLIFFMISKSKDGPLFYAFYEINITIPLEALQLKRL